jgi:uncharacterized protein (UPF0210 family)
MNLRTITLGIPWRKDDAAQLGREISEFFQKAREQFSAHGFPARTQRVTLAPFSITGSRDRTKARKTIERMSTLCSDADIRWFCVPFHTIGQNMAEVNALALEVVQQCKNAFVNYLVTGDGTVDRRGIAGAAAFIREVSLLSDNGFDNFRCGVSCNIKANGAYFPFSYNGGESGFALALEMVPLCVQVIQSVRGMPLEQIRGAIVARLVPLLQQIESIAKDIAGATGMQYFGIDASLAPHPEHPDHSVAHLIELLGVERCGCNGTVFATGFLTDIIKTVARNSGVRSTGFNGVMFSVLEDPRLGEVSAEPGNITIDSLLAYATMCGCGIDMVPVPGNISIAEIASLMLDVAAVALKLNKPLGIRLLPVPGKSAGEMTAFNHDFLHNTTVQTIRYHDCSALLTNTEQPFCYVSCRSLKK